jgi:hypothetical protein
LLPRDIERWRVVVVVAVVVVEVVPAKVGLDKSFHFPGAPPSASGRLPEKEGVEKGMRTMI